VRTHFLHSYLLCCIRISNILRMMIISEHWFNNKSSLWKKELERKKKKMKQDHLLFSFSLFSIYLYLPYTHVHTHAHTHTHRVLIHLSVYLMIYLFSIIYCYFYFSCPSLLCIMALRFRSCPRAHNKWCFSLSLFFFLSLISFFNFFLRKTDVFFSIFII